MEPRRHGMSGSFCTGYETPLNNHSNELLPAGLIQRMSLARALVVRPRILLLDKVESSLDSQSEGILIDLLQHLKGICTIVIITRHPRLLAMADQVYTIKNGNFHPLDVPTGSFKDRTGEHSGYSP